MNKDDLMKWLLIAGAAYLVYRYLQSSGVLGAKQVPAAGSTDTATTKAITDGAVSTAATAIPDTTVAVPQTATPTVAQAMMAAMIKSNYDPYSTYTGYEMNWFWQRTPLYNGIDIGPTELGISDTAKVPLAEAVTAIGRILSGVQGLGLLQRLAATPRMLSAWTM